MNIQIKQKKILFVTPLVLLLASVSLTISLGAQANSSSGTKAQAKVPADIEMKCHVELVGGGESISFTNTPYINIRELTHVLMKKKVKLNSESTAQAIYKVKECVPLQDKFKGHRAQQLLLDTPQ
ncbi:MAG: TapY2 family type IVa secretion system protein [Colwellia sp.]|nr:TapY2 family type IVa secretion system protein [Colwellia sp.]